MEVETIPFVCHNCVLSEGERERINPQCVQLRSLGKENCKLYQAYQRASNGTGTTTEIVNIIKKIHFETIAKVYHEYKELYE